MLTERRLKELENQARQLRAKDGVWRYPEKILWILPPKIEPTPPQHDGIETIASVMGRKELYLINKTKTISA